MHMDHGWYAPTEGRNPAPPGTFKSDRLLVAEKQWCWCCPELFLPTKSIQADQIQAVAADFEERPNPELLRLQVDNGEHQRDRV